ncbi:MAG: polysaccharide deacetylase family protein [Candidatus Marinimicrobia bacterium]|nr:polysaccharide deacetylase family protein [Candidatus Neomarinimicrobiota bacterium]
MWVVVRGKKEIILFLLIFLSLFFFIFLMCNRHTEKHYTVLRDAIIRGDSMRKEIALVFTGGDFSDGGRHIQCVLDQERVSAGFFFTGDFYRNEANQALIEQLVRDGHYLGPHSDRHLLYCSWENRDSLLVTKDEFRQDMLANYAEMERFGITKNNTPFFIPPYEWHNETIVQWAEELNLVLFNMSPGTLSHADYTTPDMPNYRDSKRIYWSILDYEKEHKNGLNGFILLIHIGSHPDRTDKFYKLLAPLIGELKTRDYQFKRIDRLIGKRK